MRFLVDECLSPAICAALHADGYDACHVRDRGLLNADDATVFAYAYEDDRVFVTSNIAHLVRLADTYELHAGLVLVEEGALLVADQVAVVSKAVAALAARGDAVNAKVWTSRAGVRVK